MFSVTAEMIVFMCVYAFFLFFLLYTQTASLD